MASPTSIAEIDLRPIPGKSYFQISREWREELIYFLMVDRFHDGVARGSVDGAGRSAGLPAADDFHGRNIKGINFVSALYHRHNVSLPVGFALVTKSE